MSDPDPSLQDATSASADAPHWLAPWRRRLLFWSGAVLVGLLAVGFAKGSDLAFRLFERVRGHGLAWPLLLTPATFALLAWLTNGALRATRGSGIPQAMAALQVEDAGFRARLLSLRVAAGKMALTLAALLGGASVGREGPTVHVGAGVMYSLARRFGIADAAGASRFVLAGGAAGIAAAFNTPLAGVVFAIEEMAGAYEHRMSGILLSAVIVAGVVSLGLVGNYAYFGTVQAALPLGRGWLAVLLAGAIGGLAGGVFARTILLAGRNPLSARLLALRTRWPIAFAAACGLGVAVIPLLTGCDVHGTGYAQARAILQDDGGVGTAFGAAKFLANILSYWAGIPGGIFSPALAVGAGLGQWLQTLLPAGDAAAVTLLAMCAYLSGVTQAPLTAAVICMELTANHALVLPVLATSLIARASSGLVCQTPVYRAFAQRLCDDFAAQSTAPHKGSNA